MLRTELCLPSCPQNLYVDALTLDVIVFRDRALRRSVGLGEFMKVSVPWWEWYHMSTH